MPAMLLRTTSVSVRPDINRKSRWRTFALLVGISLLGFLFASRGAYGDTIGWQERFVDVRGSHTFASEIEWVAAEGITRGCNPPENGRFCPEEYVTRGQMAAFLNRAVALGAGTATFSDTAQSVFEAEISALAEAGITRGCNPPE